ncbi:Morn repeat domain containing protein [Pandoravirus neocaledonia]|uniref:Morn repeat domain containing protein n=1 Tax=Pandoravirus neocaledonia TaxID=2107708 RepID=A0A2U7UD27_9VIRU|nr:Morn repeat domain containing protein [Pandoravirus neocaledonia]AVK76336.1 Morn repeat domain containing protein [Pandoravirus neocaledonia]
MIKSSSSSTSRENGYDDAPYETDQTPMQEPTLSGTIDNLPVEIQVMIVDRLTSPRDLLALRATSQAWRLLMTGDQGHVRALCRTLLPDEAVDRLGEHRHADALACVVYGILKTAGVSLRSLQPTQRYCTTYWVPRVMDTFCGWGLSMAESRVYGDAVPFRTWSVGRWSDDKLVDGMTRAQHVVPEVLGCMWRPHVLLAGSPCMRCRTHCALWTGRVVGGVAHGRGVWKISRCQKCRATDRLREVRCAGRWTEGALVHGTMAWGGDRVYEGEFKYNLFHGLGVLDANEKGSGTRYVGQWSRGRPDGHGTLVYERVHVDDPDPVPWQYVGDWDRGVQTGTGTKEWADGRHYAGEWHDGRPHGRGSLTYADGSRYDGEWHMGALHGHGKQFGPDGRLQRRGYWIRNSPSSRLAFRRVADEMGQERSIAQCALLAATHPFHAVKDWLDTPISF